jgi:regulator of protease activity HflC (stomatin/prohibitin superfamily)
MSSKLLVLAFPAAFLLTSCDTVNQSTGAMAPGFGEAVKYDNAIQTINPEPVYAQGGAQPGANGELGQKAVQRYRTDTVKAPQSEQTTMGSGGSGGGSGGGR